MKHRSSQELGLSPALPPPEDIEAGLARYATGLSAVDHALSSQRLAAYVALISRWAPKVNLVSAADIPGFAGHHVLPALALAPAIRAVPHDTIVDVGSGAGLPAIPLAVLLGDAELTLVESRRRRAHFLRHVVRELGLVRVKVVCSRVENWTPPHPVDLVISRAVADPASLARLAGHCLDPAGFILVTTGPRTRRLTKSLRAVLPISQHTATSALLAHPDVHRCLSSVSVESAVDEPPKVPRYPP